MVELHLINTDLQDKGLQWKVHLYAEPHLGDYEYIFYRTGRPGPLKTCAVTVPPYMSHAEGMRLICWQLLECKGG